MQIAFFSFSIWCNEILEQNLNYFVVDPRANQNTHLTILHIIYLREHLRIASILGKLNRHWDDERVYQETRNIVIAIHQHISYDEWLADIFGKDDVISNNIVYDVDNFIDDYDESQQPIAYNEFSQAANRRFHSMIADRLL